MYTEAQKKTLEMISKIGIIPVIAIDDAAKAVPLARAWSPVVCPPPRSPSAPLPRGRHQGHRR